MAPSPPPSSGSLWRHPLQALAACCFLERREALHVVAAHASGFVCSLWRIHAVSSVAFGDRSIRSSPGQLGNMSVHMGEEGGGGGGCGGGGGGGGYKKIEKVREREREREREKESEREMKRKRRKEREREREGE